MKLQMKIRPSQYYKKVHNLFTNRIFLTFLLNILFFLYALLFGRLAFETNDDREMCNFLSDVYNYGNRSYIVFVNIILGYILRFFYLAIPTINWYVIFGLIFNFIALTMITWCIYKKSNVGVGTLVSLAFLIMFYQESYVSFQFTKNAFLYLVAGFLVILSYYAQWKKKAFILALGCALMLLGSMVRFQCFEGVVPFFALALVVELFHTHKRAWKKWMPLFFVLCISFILIGGCRGLHLYQYETEPFWEYYRDYNAIRANLTDYGMYDYKQYAEEMNKMGITVEDYSLLLKWTYADSEIFSLEMLEKLGELKAKHSSSIAIISLDLLKTYISNIIDICQLYLYIYATAILILLAFMLEIKKKYPVLLFLGGMFAEWYVYVWMNRIVFRSLYGTILIGIVLSIYYLLDVEKDNIYSRWKRSLDIDLQRKCFAFFCVLLVLCSVPQSMRMISDKVYRRENVEYEELLAEVQANKNILYLVDRPTLTALEEGYSPYKVVPQGAYENVCVIGGWLYPTPQNSAALGRFKIENPMRSLAEGRDDIYLVDGISPNLKRDFLIRHYSPGLHMEVVKEYSLYKIYSFWK